MTTGRPRQQGMALLLALGTVAIVAALAAAAIARQSMLIQSEEISRDRHQAKLVAMGAMDWARLILRQDARGSPIDHLGEPWAIPIQNAALSDFIDAPASDLATLSGRIVDEQGKINIMGTIIARGADDLEYDYKFISLLAERLQIPQSDVNAILSARFELIQSSALNLFRLSCPRLDELGISPASAKALSPYLTILPERTALNVNTASELALQAYIPGLSAAQAQAIASTRKTKPFDSLPQFVWAIAPTPLPLGATLSFESSYFSATMSLSTPNGRLDQRALFKRAGSTVSTLCLRSIDPSQAGAP